MASTRLVPAWRVGNLIPCGDDPGVRGGGRGQAIDAQCGSPRCPFSWVGTRAWPVSQIHRCPGTGPDPSGDTMALRSRPCQGSSLTMSPRAHDAQAVGSCSHHPTPSVQTRQRKAGRMQQTKRTAITIYGRLTMVLHRLQCTRSHPWSFSLNKNRNSSLIQDFPIPPPTPKSPLHR